MKITDLLEAPIVPVAPGAAPPVAPGVAPATGPGAAQQGLSPQQQLAAARQAEESRKKGIRTQIAELEKQIAALRAQMLRPA